MDTDMPELDSANRGLCANCHNPHGTTNPFDMLTSTYIDPGPNANYQLCFDCHNSTTGPLGMDTANTLIEDFYNQSPNGGHRIKCSTKAVTGTCPPDGISVGDKMPCYNCHNPHGSKGNDGINPNTNLLSDQRSGWSGLTDTLNTASQVRSFCLGCHVPSDGTPGSNTVMDISMNAIPAVSGAHETSATASCYGCHGSSYTAGTDTNVHNPDPGGTCLTCHQNQQVGDTYTRRAITSEFGLAWGHKNSGKVGTYPLTEADCAVCHMEANSTSNPTPGSLHANEEVDLRDPDTGTQIQYLGADYSFGQFSRDTNNATLETWTTVVQNQQCLKCHDSDGALSTAARVPSTGTSTDPWGTGASVVDVDAMFDTTNSTFHPVKGAQNNSYADIDTMVSPWNQYSKTPGTPSPGDLISCFDCHNSSSPLATGTVAAHGNNVTLRADLQYNIALDSVESVATSLCSVCHLPAVYESGSAGLSAFGGVDTGLSSSGSRYIPGATGSAMHANRMDWACFSCHGSSWLDPGRPRRAQDVHGFNTMVGGATTWGTEPDTGQPGARPYAFLRNNDLKGTGRGGVEVRWDGWRPRFDGATDNTTNGWGCSWRDPQGGSQPCNRSDHSDLWLSYGPGGTY
jgi:predicted CXXCH cytochrome family protein